MKTKQKSWTEKSLAEKDAGRAYARGMYDAVCGSVQFATVYHSDHPLKAEYDYGYHNGLIVLTNAGVVR